MGKKTKSALAVPGNRAEAEAAIAGIGAAQRELALIQASLDERVAVAKKDAEDASRVLVERVKTLTGGLQVWAQTNRAELTDGGKRQHARLATGTLAWRKRPASVRISGVEAVIARIKALGLQRFLRVKEECNREAMLAEPDVAGGIDGVSIGSGGEDFLVEPIGVALAEGGR